MKKTIALALCALLALTALAGCGQAAEAEVQLDELAFTCIETPGHTEGGVTYRVDGALFTGDTLFKESAGRTDLYGGDYGKLKASLAKLAALEGDFAVYPGHGDATTLEYERQTNSYIGLQDYDTYF